MNSVNQWTIFLVYLCILKAIIISNTKLEKNEFELSSLVQIRGQKAHDARRKKLEFTSCIFCEIWKEGVESFTQMVSLRPGYQFGCKDNNKEVQDSINLSHCCCHFWFLHLMIVITYGGSSWSFPWYFIVYVYILQMILLLFVPHKYIFIRDFCYW